MKKTTSVTLGFIMSAVIVAGCGEQRRCVDAEGLVVANELCKEEGRRSGSSTGSRIGGHRWYYGGGSEGVGSRATGGSFEPTSRGGFGKLASFHGSGDGGS